MKTNKVTVIGFDCDGVLFDSSRANRSYYNTILRRFGLPELTDLQFAYVHMHTVDQAFVYLIEDPDLRASVHQYRRRLSYQPFIRHMTMEPHLRDLLEHLRPTYKTAIATNRTNTMAHVLDWHGLQAQFDKVVTASDVRHAKPHPEQLLKLMAYFGISPTQMIYIGDSELDAAAARQAQVPFVAYDNPGLQAMAHIQNLGQVRDLLGG